MKKITGMAYILTAGKLPVIKIFLDIQDMKGKQT